jgi:hypothetical protein
VNPRQAKISQLQRPDLDHPDISVWKHLGGRKHRAALPPAKCGYARPTVGIYLMVSKGALTSDT